jgi:hypothetical protein
MKMRKLYERRKNNNYDNTLKCDGDKRRVSERLNESERAFKEMLLFIKSNFKRAHVLKFLLLILHQNFF